MSFRVAFIAGATANDEFRSTMALSEYDGLFIDPENLRDPDATLLSGRRKEIELLLSSGGVVVIFARPRVEIGTGIDNYSWLLNRPFEIVARDGVSVRRKRRDTPFSLIFDTYVDGRPADASMYFQVVLEEIPPDLPGRQILVENKAGEVIGLLYKELNGTVAVIPPIREIDDRFRSIIQEIIRRLKERRSSIELAPEWVRSMAPLPGEPRQVEAIDTLEVDIARLSEQREKELGALEELRNLKALLWESGSLGLEPAIRHALDILGFEVGSTTAENTARTAATIRTGDTTLLYEVDASEKLVQLDGFRKLHESVTEMLLEEGIEARGILFGNGYRLKPVADRPGTFSENCLGGCAKFSYAAVPTMELYRAVEAVLRTPNNEELKNTIRRSLVETAGAWRWEGHTL